MQRFINCVLIKKEGIRIQIFKSPFLKGDLGVFWDAKNPPRPL